MTREQWLGDAVEIMRPWFADNDKPLPETVRVSVGWPKGKRKAIGVCHSSNSAADSVPQVFISPSIADPVQVLATLLHELVHAADDCQNGHKAEFARVARALGLTGKMTATIPGEELTATLTNVSDKLGAYPHSVLTPAQKPQGTRMLKALCHGCGYTFRLTQKWANLGLPDCVCGEEMSMA